MKNEILINVSPNLKKAYDEQYDDNMKVWRELGGKYKAKHIVELSKGIEHKKVLEVGAGEGAILHFLDQWEFAEELHAVEISKSGIEYIKKREIKSLTCIQQFNGYVLPYEDNSFDLIVISHVIEHVEFPRLLLREILRVSEYQVFEIPCDYSVNVDKNVSHFLSYGHINVYSPALFRFLLLSEGYEIINDLCSLTAIDVIEYNVFINQGKPRTFISQMKLRLQAWKKEREFITAPKIHREQMASAYTILTRKAREKS
jgi:ubiquinone/menaquinone biosynthesis C-methylase UbiE